MWTHLATKLTGHINSFYLYDLWPFGCVWEEGDRCICKCITWWCKIVGMVRKLETNRHERCGYIHSLIICQNLGQNILVSLYKLH